MASIPEVIASILGQPSAPFCPNVPWPLWSNQGSTASGPTTTWSANTSASYDASECDDPEGSRPELLIRPFAFDVYREANGEPCSNLGRDFSWGNGRVDRSTLLRHFKQTKVGTSLSCQYGIGQFRTHRCLSCFRQACCNSPCLRSAHLPEYSCGKRKPRSGERNRKASLVRH